MKTWVMADPHFYHQGVCEFTRADGVTPLRPWDDAQRMTEDMVYMWNETVHPEDRVYLLGDVAFSAANMKRVVPRLNGRICLVPGNHEPTKMRKYFDLFDDVRGYVVKKGLIMSHIPIHPGSLSRWKINIHGHTHSNVVMEQHGDVFLKSPDKRYVCVSAEHTEFKPMDLQILIDKHVNI